MVRVLGSAKIVSITMRFEQSKEFGKMRKNDRFKYSSVGSTYLVVLFSLIRILFISLGIHR